MDKEKKKSLDEMNNQILKGSEHKKETGKMPMVCEEIEKITIDVYHDEMGEDFYRVYLYNEYEHGKQQMPSACQSGWFVHECDLQEWLEDNASVIKVVKDYRDGVDG